MAPGCDLYSFQREGADYRLNGKLIDLSVTKAIRLAGVCRFYATREEMTKYLLRGRDVHLITADMDNHIGDPGADYWSAGPFAGYAAAWAAFRKQAGFYPDKIEQKVYHPLFKYAGTYDRLGWINYHTTRQRRLLLDVKTGSSEPWHREQTAGYWLTLSEAERSITDRMAVCLQADGKFHIVPHTNAIEDRDNFISELRVARLRQSRGVVQDDHLFDEVLHEVITQFNPFQFTEEIRK